MMTSLSLIVCAIVASPAITLFYMRHCNMIATKEVRNQKSDEVKNIRIVRMTLSKEDKEIKEDNEIVVYPNYLKGNIPILYAN